MKRIIAAFAICLATATLAVAEEARIITTTGMGSVERAPDMAMVSLGVTHQAPQAADALAATSTGVAVVLDRLAEASVAERDVQTGTISPSINIETLDPAVAATGLNVTPNVAVQKPVRGALANSFGFGGTNASLVFQAI